MITPSFSLTATERILPKLALDFTTAILDSRVTFTRSGNTATVTNSSGYIAGINANLPRFDYDPISLSCKGLLIEEARINLILQSSNFATTWAAEGVSISVDVVNSPENVINADLLDATTGNCRIGQAVTILGSTTYTFSVFLKKNNSSNTRIQLFSTGGANPNKNGDINFNFDTLALSATGDATNPIAKAYRDGWYRISGTFTTASTHNLGAFYIYPGGAFGSTGKVYAWGAQLEAGAFATSYIPATTAAATRDADVATMIGANFSNWYSQTAGTVYIEFSRPSPAASSFAVQISNNSFSEFIGIYTDGTPNMIASVRDNNLVQFFTTLVSGTGVANTYYRQALAYQVNNFAACSNGGTVSIDTLGTLPTTDRMIIGAFTSSSQFLNGYIRRISYYPLRLTNSELQAITS